MHAKTHKEFWDYPSLYGGCSDDYQRCEYFQQQIIKTFRQEALLRSDMFLVCYKKRVHTFL